MMDIRQLAARACAQSVDFSAVSGTRILPFRFYLDEASSNLSSSDGELQRFCYTVEGVGEDTAAYADLSHFLLGICRNIPLDALSDVSVTIDGVPQTVVLGENVEIRTEDAPDPPTGCTGVKFDFPLDKAGGVMRFCFSLTSPYPVGSAPVCLYGGGVTAAGLSICGPVCEPTEACPVIGYQRATVCVPVTVTPYVYTGESASYCCSAPAVTPGVASCAGTPRGSCTFTITQDVCVAVPVWFGATASVGEHTVACGDGTAENVCASCRIT